MKNWTIVATYPNDWMPT